MYEVEFDLETVEEHSLSTVPFVEGPTKVSIIIDEGLQDVAFGVKVS